MKLKVFSVYDHKGEAYGKPVFLATAGLAVRAFQEVANDKTSEVGKFPQDYTLFEIGEFDDSTGVLTPLSPHVTYGLAAALVKPEMPMAQNAKEGVPFDMLKGKSVNEIRKERVAK